MTESSSTVKTRLCIVSDTHTRLPEPANSTNTAFRLPLPTADVLLHAGDLTMVGKEHEHERTVSFLKEANAELKIVIAGNHDITLDKKYYQEFGWRRHRSQPQNLDHIRDLYCGEEAQKHGIRYMEEGIQTFQLRNGAKLTVYASPFQPEFCHWAFGYPRNIDRYNPSPQDAYFQAPNPVPDFPGVDVMITHGPPHGVLDQVHEDYSVGCEHLRRAAARCRPRLHCFGHIHEGWGAARMRWDDERLDLVETRREKVLQDRSAYVDVSGESEKPLVRGKETLFVNGSILDVSYDPVNAPWVVDLELPCS